MRDLGKMMKQVQEMQKQMAKAQEELAGEEVEASAGGGMVTVKVTGDLRITSIKIDPGALTPADRATLDLADAIYKAPNRDPKYAIQRTRPTRRRSSAWPPRTKRRRTTAKR